MAGFKIPSIPPTTNKTIRFPNDVIEEVEQAIVGKDCTFSAFVIAAVRAALEELKEAGSCPGTNRGRRGLSLYASYHFPPSGEWIPLTQE